MMIFKCGQTYIYIKIDNGGTKTILGPARARAGKIDIAHYFFVELSKPFIEMLSLTPGRYPSRGSVPPSGRGLLAWFSIIITFYLNNDFMALPFKQHLTSIFGCLRDWLPL